MQRNSTSDVFILELFIVIVYSKNTSNAMHTH